MSSLKKASGAAVLSLAVMFGSGSIAAAEPNPNGVVRNYNTYPGRVTGMVAPNAQVTDGTFTSTDGKGTQIYWKKNTVPNAKGTIALIHGLAENQQRYDYIAYRLNLAGYNVYRLDHRGHGRSAEPYNNVHKGLIDNFNFVMDDMKQLVDMIHREQSGKVVMMGHSMGAIAVQMYSVLYPETIDSTVTNGGGIPVNMFGQNTLMPEYKHADGQSYPFFIGPFLPHDSRRPFESVDSLFGYNVQGFLDHFGIKLPADAAKPVESPDFLKGIDVPNAFKLGVVSDPDVRDQLSNDPLNSKTVNASTLYQIVSSWVYTSAHAKNYTKPTLIMHGDIDGLVPYPLDINWYNAVGSTDKQMVLWKDSMHETMSEPSRDEVIDRAIGFIDSH
ncbi:alpha/beta fold hydrolase [Corynebacterium kroppenstedtii]|uniref:alpha/beta fold hydrolase n=1 Tax=Corynebacterium sp. PCR 32 TaxID=3351342 RepID=UPI00309D3213